MTSRLAETNDPVERYALLGKIKDVADKNMKEFSAAFLDPAVRAHFPDKTKTPYGTVETTFKADGKYVFDNAIIQKVLGMARFLKIAKISGITDLKAEVSSVELDEITKQGGMTAPGKSVTLKFTASKE